jgi:DNA repair exonuclease SbcCD ATPase subunit
MRESDLRTARATHDAVVRRLAEWERQAARADGVRTDLRVHEELDDAFGELRTDLNAQLRPDLAELASVFLADLTDGRYHELELDDQYRILLLEEGEPRPVISGGEEDVANLVLRLAISQMVDLRLPGRAAARARRGAAAPPGRPLPAGRPDHAHRVRARQCGPGAAGGRGRGQRRRRRT